MKPCPSLGLAAAWVGSTVVQILLLHTYVSTCVTPGGHVIESLYHITVADAPL